MDIKDFIPRGKENAISREMLRTLTGCSDREIRKMIREARLNHEGSFILSSSDVSGYWLSDNLTEVRAFCLKPIIGQKTQMQLYRCISRSLRTERQPPSGEKAFCLPRERMES